MKTRQGTHFWGHSMQMPCLHAVVFQVISATKFYTYSFSFKLCDIFMQNLKRKYSLIHKVEHKV